ncbi:hypothetical protein BC629DRAFT_644902 [Irpex lacteus]|nr:hypothetical protein BC629DRAFT_644902 [Irpex lacteus]
MHLSLRSVRDTEDVGICAHILVGLLADNPHLESISLSSVIKPDRRRGDTSPRISLRKVRLEFLRFLSIYDDQSHLLRLLPLLDLPSIRNVKIHQRDIDTIGNQVESLLQAILDKFSHLPAEYRYVRRLEYSVGEPANVCITVLFHTELDSSTSPTASERSCHIVFSLTRSSPKWNEWSGVLTKMFTLRRLQQLRVGCTDHRNNNNRHMLPLWKSILFQTSLKELSVEKDILQSFWRILAEALPAVSSAGKVDDEELYAFPSLTVLDIHMTNIPDLVIGPVVFEDAHSHGVDHQQKAEVRSGLQLIQTWSKRRPGGGALTLKLSSCLFPVPWNANSSYMVNVEMQIVDGKVILPALTARSHSADTLVMEFLRDNVA